MYKIAGQNTIIKTADLKVLVKKEKKDLHFVRKLR